MCGINGILSREYNSQNEDIVGKMNASMPHRGPDNSGIFADKNIVLGHRRLSIIDLSIEANQPMGDNSGRYTIVYNGEIYNFKKLKKELKDYNFKTNSDSETILACYIYFGEKCLEKLEGMFAFAIWDKLEKNLFIARDRIGIKPLYYYYENNNFIFSSEIRAILNSGIPARKLNTKAVSDYLRYQTVHAPETIVENIKSLMPGEFMNVNKNGISINKYYQISDFKPLPIDSNIDEIKKTVSNLLYEAVEKRMVADVPFGAFLSGGIDSSIIVGLMSKISTGKVNTFSVSFNDEEYSEAKYARLIAKKFNTEHTEIKLDPNDFLNIIPQALKSFDHPSADGINSYIVSKVTKESGVTMALSGLGGDELFAGYDIFKRMYSLNKNKLIKSIPYPIRKLSGNLAYSLYKSTSTQKIKDTLSIKEFDFPGIYSISRQVFSEPEIQNLIDSRFIGENSVKQIIKGVYDENKSILSNVSLSEINTYMQNVLLGDADQMSMASSLEVRVPFLDHKLIKYVLSIPDDIKFPHSPKQLLVESVGFLPDEIVNRPKMGFLLPWQNWLKNELRDFAKEKINELKNNDIFVSQSIESLWQRFLSNDKEVKWAKIWLLISLQNYIKENKLT